MSTEREMVKPAQQAAEVFKPGKSSTPDVDIFVNDDEILLVADLPGVAKDDLSINLENNILTIEGTFTHGLPPGVHPAQRNRCGKNHGGIPAGGSLSPSAQIRCGQTMPNRGQRRLLTAEGR